MINYQLLLDAALRSVAKEALIRARLDGLGENGHLNITFKTRMPGVVIPDFLKLRFPDTMTIVLQWTFSNLNVSDTGFGVTLTFDGRPYYIQVPFDALTEFKDLQTEFIIQFQSTGQTEAAAAAPELPLEEKKPAKDPRVLSMEEFRRRRKN